MKYRYWRR